MKNFALELALKEKIGEEGNSQIIVYWLHKRYTLAWRYGFYTASWQEQDLAHVSTLWGTNLGLPIGRGSLGHCHT